jgi:hypothetical protein
VTVHLAHSDPAATVPRAEDAVLRTAAGIPITFQLLPPPHALPTGDPGPLRLHLQYWQLHLLRDFDQLLCLEGLTGVEHLPHQIETVRKVLRRFRGRVLLADAFGIAVARGTRVEVPPGVLHSAANWYGRPSGVLAPHRPRACLNGFRQEPQAG